MIDDTAAGVDASDDEQAVRVADEPPVHDTDERPLRVLHYADVENVYDHPGRVGRLAGLVRAERDDRTLVIGAGDDTALGVLALLTDEGRAQARPYFETVRPDADTFGNHDLDYGDGWAADWAESVPATYVCANLEGSTADRIPDATVFERGGTRIGVVGVSHPKSHEISGTDLDVRFTDPAIAAAEAAADLRSGGVDHVVVASHAGEHDPSIAEAADADVVLGGHIHERRTERIDGTLLVRTGGNGTELSAVTLGDRPTVEYHEIPDGPPEDGEPFDATLAAEYRHRREAVGVDEVIAAVEEPFPRTERERFRAESRLGNFAADAFRETADADVGLFPAGSLRPGPALSGEVTLAEVVGLCPFDGAVCELDLSGAEFREALESVADPHPAGRGWVHLHVSGARVVWTDANEVRSVEVGGKPLDPDGRYRVATAAYVVMVDDYGPLGESNVAVEHAPQYEVLVEHARNGGLDVELSGRIERAPATEAGR